MICVLRVVEGPAKGMKCWLKKDQSLTIGRQIDSDFSIATDAHMSRNHLIVEGLETTFRLRDVGSSNGTYVNDFPISVVELCHGDRIKAGSSVFVVDLAADQQAPKEPVVQPDEEVFDSFVPNRTISAEMLEHDQDITMRYQMENPEIDTAGRGAPTEMVDRQQPKNELPPASPNPPLPSSSPSGAQAAPELQAEAAAEINKRPQPAPPASEPASEAPRSQPRPIDGIPSKFLAGFSPTADDHLWRQSAEAAVWEPVRLIDCLLASPWKTHVTVVVNRSQVDASQNGTLDFAITAGESRALTETLYLLQSSHLESVLEFYKRCLTKDAAVCIASPKSLPDEWFLDAIDILSYPSMLFDLLSSSPGRARQLAQGVQFVMFEPNTQGELCLLRSPA